MTSTPFARHLRGALLAALAAAATFAMPAGAAGLKAYVGNFKDSTVSVIDTAANTVIATVPVATGPDGIVVTHDGRAAYVAGSSASSVSLIDTATDRVTQAIETGKGPQGLALTPDGRWVLVAVNGEDRVALIDAATHAIAGTIAIAKPHTIAVQPDGKRAWVSSQETGHFALAIVDLAARKVVGSVALEKPPRDLEFGNDGRHLYFTMAGVAAVQVLDPASEKVVGQIATGPSPHLAHFFAKTGTGVIVVQGPGELQLFDPATLAPTRTIAVGKQPHWVDTLGDGQHVLVTNEGSNSVTVVDLASGQTSTIAVGQAPRKIAIQPSTSGSAKVASNSAAPAATHSAKVVASNLVAPVAASAGAPAAAQVTIDNFAFAPGNITVKRGTTVAWVNKDGAPHGLAFKDGAPGSELMLPGAGFSRRFDQAGTFDYICSVHSYMTARVTVQ